MSEDWSNMSACDLGRGIEDGRIDPVALTEHFLSAIDAHPYRDRIYARTTPARARAEAAAAAARARMGTRRSLLDGVPISWKDLVDTAGTPTEAGSALLAGRVPDQDAVVLANATHAGLVCLGKTHMTELAFSGIGLNPVTATPPNVNDPALAPGGSSSGAATSTAFGLAAAGIGSDTGGSVRVPAAWNNLVGMKTTHGALSLDGVVKLCGTFDTIGPLTRSVEDAAHLTAIMAGQPVPDTSRAQLKGLRFLVCADPALTGAEDDTLTGFNAALDAIEAAGARIDRADSPAAAEALSMSGVIYTSEAYATCGELIESAPDKMFAAVRERFEAGRNYSAIDYIRAMQRLDELRRIWARDTAGYSGVLIPTSPILPPDVARLQGDLDYFVERNVKALRNTRIGNLMGLCALTLPTGTPAAGISLMGAPGRDHAILRIGAAIEAVLKG